MRTLIDAQRNHDAAKRCRANAFAVRLALAGLEKRYGKNTVIRAEYERTIAGLESEADEYDRLAARITRDYAGAIQECA
jgi:hypothetical protein